MSLTQNAGQLNVSLGERYTESAHMRVHPPTPGECGDGERAGYLERMASREPGC